MAIGGRRPCTSIPPRTPEPRTGVIDAQWPGERARGVPTGQALERALSLKHDGSVDESQLDEFGYLAPLTDRPVPLSRTVGGQTFYRRDALISALWAYGEDHLMSRAREGLDRDEVEAIGRRAAELVYTADPSGKSGDGYRFEQALAMSAVEVLDQVRPLARKRRRSQPR
jgi:hypothetical protein